MYLLLFYYYLNQDNYAINFIFLELTYYFHLKFLKWLMKQGQRVVHKNVSQGCDILKANVVFV